MILRDKPFLIMLIVLLLSSAMFGLLLNNKNKINTELLNKNEKILKELSDVKNELSSVKYDFDMIRKDNNIYKKYIIELGREKKDKAKLILNKKDYESLYNQFNSNGLLITNGENSELIRAVEKKNEALKRNLDYQEVIKNKNNKINVIYEGVINFKEYLKLDEIKKENKDRFNLKIAISNSSIESNFINLLKNTEPANSTKRIIKYLSNPVFADKLQIMSQLSCFSFDEGIKDEKCRIHIYNILREKFNLDTKRIQISRYLSIYDNSGEFIGGNRFIIKEKGKEDIIYENKNFSDLYKLEEIRRTRTDGRKILPDEL